MSRMDVYESLGDPEDDAPPTAAQRRDQLQAEEIQAHAKKMASEMPPLTDEQVEAVRAVFRSVTPAPPGQVMMWRVRYFCGHRVVASSRAENTEIHQALGQPRKCPECGLFPATLLAAKAIGLKSDVGQDGNGSPGADAPGSTGAGDLSQTASKAGRRDTEKRIKALEAEIAQLRRSLDS